MTKPHPADVHAGDDATTIAAALTEAFDAVLQAVAALDLRPTTVDTNRQVGLTSVSVYFPTNDVDAVDTLGDRFRLPPALGDAGRGAVFYTRTGLTELGKIAGTLTIRTVRPGVDLELPGETPETAPRVITGELAAVPARRELDPIPAR